MNERQEWQKMIDFDWLLDLVQLKKEWKKESENQQSSAPLNLKKIESFIDQKNTLSAVTQES